MPLNLIRLAAIAAVVTAAPAAAQSFPGIPGAYDSSNVQGWTYLGSPDGHMQVWRPAGESEPADGAACTVTAGSSELTAADFAADLAGIDAHRYFGLLMAQGVPVLDVDRVLFTEIEGGHMLFSVYSMQGQGGDTGVVSVFTRFGEAEVTATCGARLDQFPARYDSFLLFLDSLVFTGAN